MSGLTGFTTNVNGAQVDLSYIFQNGNYVIDFNNNAFSSITGYVMSYTSSNYNLPNFSNNSTPLLFDTTNTINDTFTNCLLTTNFKQNAIDLSYIQVTPNQGTNFGITGWLRSKYYIYQYPNLKINSFANSYLITQESTRTLTLDTSVVGFKFIAIGGGGAGQNAGGADGAPIVGVGGSGGGCVIGYHNFASNDPKLLTITIGVGGVAGSSGQYSPTNYPYFGNTSASQGSDAGANGNNSSITFNNNSNSIIAGGGPGGNFGPQPGSASSATNITYFHKYESTSPTSFAQYQPGTNSGFMVAYANNPNLQYIRSIIQPNVYQTNSVSQLIITPYTNNQLNLSYMYGNAYYTSNTSIGFGAYSSTVNNVGSGGYGGCRHDQTLLTIGYYGNDQQSGPSGAGPGSAGAPGLVLIVPQFTTITSF